MESKNCISLVDATPQPPHKRLRYSTISHLLNLITNRSPLQFQNLQKEELEGTLDNICKHLSRGCECSSCSLAFDNDWLKWEKSPIKPLSPIYDLLELAVTTEIELETVRSKLVSDVMWKHEKPDGRQFMLVNAFKKLQIEPDKLLKGTQLFYPLAGSYLKEFDFSNIHHKFDTEGAALIHAVSFAKPKLLKLVIGDYQNPKDGDGKPTMYRMLKDILEASKYSLQDLTLPINRAMVRTAVVRAHLHKIKTLKFSGICKNKEENNNIVRTLGDLFETRAPLTKLSVTYQCSKDWLIPAFALMARRLKTLELKIRNDPKSGNVENEENEVLEFVKAQPSYSLLRVFSKISTLVAHFAFGMNVLSYLISNNMIPKLADLEVICCDEVFDNGFFRDPMEKLKVIGPFLKRLSIQTEADYFVFLESHGIAMQMHCPEIRVLHLRCQIEGVEQLASYIQSISSLKEISISYPKYGETLINDSFSRKITNALQLTTSKLERIDYTSFISKPSEANGILQHHSSHIKCLRIVCSSYEVSEPERHLISLVDGIMLHESAKNCNNLENLDVGFVEGSHINPIKDRYDIPPYRIQELILRNENMIPRLRNQSRDWTTPHIPVRYFGILYQ